MSILIPYDENIYKKNEAFIKPNGEILFTYGDHEPFAQQYCEGPYYNILSKIKDGDPIALDIYRKESGFDGNIEDIDEYSSSNLTKEQLEWYKYWLGVYCYNWHVTPADFLVYMLQFDKVETIIRQCITTTCSNPHTRFWNYYLMDWRIDTQRPNIYNNEYGIVPVRNKYYLANRGEDANVAEEIERIKADVMIKDRHLFFK